MAKTVDMLVENAVATEMPAEAAPAEDTSSADEGEEAADEG
jgi:hypothetical protein